MRKVKFIFSLLTLLFFTPIIFPVAAQQETISVGAFNAERTSFVIANDNGGPPPGFALSRMGTIYSRLSNDFNFGINGVVKCDIDFNNMLGNITKGDLVNDDGSLTTDVFFAPPTHQSLSEEEAIELAKYVYSGGILYLSGHGSDDATNADGTEFNLLFSKLNISDVFTEIKSGSIIPSIQSLQPLPSLSTTGPFGNIGPIKHGQYRVFSNTSLVGTIMSGDASEYVVFEKKIGEGYLVVTTVTLFQNAVMDDSDNINFFLNLFSLGCRDDWRSNAVVLDVPSFKQGSDETNPEWGEIIYDSGDTLKLECDLDNNGATMRECGCALSAAAMVMNYLGVKTSHTGLSVNPGALNIIYRYFPKPDAPPYGFINGLVNWFSVSNLSALAHQAYPTQPKLELPVRENYSYERIVQYIESGIPVILRVNNGSHWVVVKGYDPDTQRLVINDPAYADPPIGLFTYLNERYIPDTINSMIVYTPTQSDFRYIQVAAEEGIDLTLTDAGGNNLSNAEYVFEHNYINPSLSSLGSAGGYHIFTFKLPDDGDYLVSSTGNFYVYTSDTEGNMVGKEVNQSAERKTYKLTYFEASAGEGIHIQEMVNEPEVLEVQIDVRPWSRWDWLFLKGLLPVPVTIFSSHEFDATSIDENTLLLGVTGTEDSLYGCQRWDFDLNRDRRKDKLCWFNARKMGLEKSTSEIILTGIAGDTTILGYDTVKVY